MPLKWAQIDLTNALLRQGPHTCRHARIKLARTRVHVTGHAFTYGKKNLLFATSSVVVIFQDPTREAAKKSQSVLCCSVLRLFCYSPSFLPSLVSSLRRRDCDPYSKRPHFHLDNTCVWVHACIYGPRPWTLSFPGPCLSQWKPWDGREQDNKGRREGGAGGLTLIRAVFCGGVAQVLHTHDHQRQGESE